MFSFVLFILKNKVGVVSSRPLHRPGREDLNKRVWQINEHNAWSHSKE